MDSCACTCIFGVLNKVRGYQPLVDSSYWLRRCRDNDNSRGIRKQPPIDHPRWCYARGILCRGIHMSFIFRTRNVGYQIDRDLSLHRPTKAYIGLCRSNHSRHLSSTSPLGGRAELWSLRARAVSITFVAASESQARYNTVNYIRLMNNITYSWCRPTWGESVLVCLKFLRFVQFSLINNQYVEPKSSAHLRRFLKKLVKFTCFISFPLMFIWTLSVLYFLPFGENIMKWFLLLFRKSLLAWNQVVIFLQFFIYLFH